jgi:hypothetical protein
MSYTIWKFPLHTVDRQDVKMPVGAEVLCVQMQEDTPCLWALVNPDAAPTTRTFATYGTGHPVDASGAYIGTYQWADGSLVFHVFDVS